MTEIPADQARPDSAAAHVGGAGRLEVLAIGNAGAGSAAEEGLAAAMVELRRRADVELVVPADAEELRAALEVRGGRRVVVLGGDGSLHAAVGALARLEALDDAGPLAVVPLGTGNDLARGLGIPDDPAEAARVALDGVPARLDLLRADDGEVVVNAVHAGIGAEAALRTPTHKDLLGPAAYAVGAVRAGATQRGWRLRVTVDGQVLHDGSEPVLMVAVGLGSSVGGGAQVAPGASPSDGLADVVVSTATGPLARVGYALAMARGQHVERDDVVRDRGRSVTVEAAGDEDAFPTSADGEVHGPFRRRTWQVLPGAWQLLVPR